MTKFVSVLSGGLDSTTALYKALDDKDDEVVKAVSFNYGQRHKKELEYARATAERLEIPHITINLWSAGVTDAIAGSGSSLIDGGETAIPEGHYAEENMKATVVPNRNMIMLSIAASIAVAEKANGIIAGMHQGDHAIYPDCRPEFIDTLGRALVHGNRGFGDLDPVQPIWAPFLFSTKDDIAYEAIRLDVPIHLTWSCYKGSEIHCGRCGTCVERLESIYNAEIRFAEEEGLSPAVRKFDQTEYEDTKFWQEVLAHDID